MFRLCISLPLMALLLAPVAARSQTTMDVMRPTLGCNSGGTCQANGQELVGELCNGIQGCCPVEPYEPIVTPCESRLDKYDPLNTYVDLFDEEDGVPWRFKPVFPRSTYNVAGSALYDASTVARESGEDECGKTGDVASTRVACFDKVFDKEDNACLWRTELIMGAAMAVTTSASQPHSVGRTKIPGALPDVVCQQHFNIIPEDKPYVNTFDDDGMTAGKIVRHAFQKFATPGAFNESIWAADMHTSGPGPDRVFAASAYSGKLNPFADLTLPGIDAAFARAVGEHFYDRPVTASRPEHNPPDMMELLFGGRGKNVLNTDEEYRFLAGREWRGADSFGELPWAEGYEAAFEGQEFQEMQDTMAELTLTDLQQSRYNRFSDPSHLYSPFDKFLLYPEDLHYSPLTRGGGLAGADYKPYPAVGAGYGSSNDRAVRCSGTMDRRIPVNVMIPRYQEFNYQILKRITFNRMCRANFQSITPPWCKTILCNGCWKRCCWDGVGSDNPPARTNWDSSRDPAYDKSRPGSPFRWINEPHVREIIAGVLSGVDYEDVESEHIEEVCHDLAKPMPMINNQPQVDIREVAEAGLTMIGPEATFYGYFNDARPYVAMPNTTLEYGQTGARPDYYSTEGAYIGYAGTTQLPPDVTLLTRNQSPALRQYADKDKGQSLAQSLFKNVSRANAQVRGPQLPIGPCIGGMGAMEGEEGCANTDVHPTFGPMGEQILQQARTKRETGHSCMPHYGRQMYKGPEAMMSDLHNAAINLPVPDDDGNETGITRTIRQTLACRGLINSPVPSQAFPNGAGATAPKMRTGLGQLNEYAADPEKSEEGAVVILEDGGAPEGELPGQKTLAVVTKVGPNFFDAFVTDIGLGPGPLGHNIGSSARTIRRFYKPGEMPDWIKAEYDELGIPHHCAVAAQSSGACELDRWDERQFFHPAESRNEID